MHARDAHGVRASTIISRSSLTACRAVCSRNFAFADSSAAALAEAFSVRTCGRGYIMIC